MRQQTVGYVEVMEVKATVADLRGANRCGTLSVTGLAAAINMQTSMDAVDSFILARRILQVDPKFFDIGSPTQCVGRITQQIFRVGGPDELIWLKDSLVRMIDSGWFDRFEPFFA